MLDTLEVYRGFLSLEFSKAVIVPAPLLSELERAGVIDDNERAMIDSKILRNDKRGELFIRIMPAKNRACQQQLVEILSKLKLYQISDYLRSWIPCLAIRTLMAEPIWKQDRSINEQDKAHKLELINGYLKELENKKGIGDFKYHPEIIHIYVRLGELYYEIENYVEAAVHFKRSIQAKDSSNYLKATAKFSLARCYFEMAEYLDAKNLLQQCLLALQQFYDLQRPAVFLTLYWYALTLSNLNNLKSAEEMFHSSLELGRKIYGSVSFEVAVILCDLGELYFRNDRLETSESTLVEAYEIQQKIISSKNPLLSLRILSSLASFYKSQNNQEKAQLISNQALEIYNTTSDPKTIIICWRLMHVYSCKDDFDNTERIVNAAMKILDEKFVSMNYNNGWRARFLYKLAQVRYLQKRFADAIAMCKTVFEKIESLPLWNTPDNFCYETLSVRDCLQNKKNFEILEWLASCTFETNKPGDIDRIKLRLKDLTERGGPRDTIDLKIPVPVPVTASKESEKLSVRRLTEMFEKKRLQADAARAQESKELNLPVRFTDTRYSESMRTKLGAAFSEMEIENPGDVFKVAIPPPPRKEVLRKISSLKHDRSDPPDIMLHSKTMQGCVTKIKIGITSIGMVDIYAMLKRFALGYNDFNSRVPPFRLIAVDKNSLYCELNGSLVQLKFWGLLIDDIIHNGLPIWVPLVFDDLINFPLSNYLYSKTLDLFLLCFDASISLKDTFEHYRSIRQALIDRTIDQVDMNLPLTLVSMRNNSATSKSVVDERKSRLMKQTHAISIIDCITDRSESIVELLKNIHESFESLRMVPSAGISKNSTYALPSYEESQRKLVHTVC